jgi:hypothetical protein
MGRWRTLVQLFITVMKNDTSVCSTGFSRVLLGGSTVWCRVCSCSRSVSGHRTIRAILADLDKTIPHTFNDFEELFHGFLLRFGLPLPRFNEWLELNGLRPDAVWHGQQVIVELDGAAVHRTRRNLERDPARDRMLVVAG